MSRLRRNLQTASIAIVFSLLASGAAWLGFVGWCMYDARWSLCRHPAGGWLVIIATLAVCWLWIARHLAERLRRRLRKGMWAGRAASFGLQVSGWQWVENTVHFALEGEWPASPGHPLDDNARLGWWVWVPCDGGKEVWVNKQRYYEWLLDVMALKNSLAAGESPIAQRRWEPELGRPLWMAYCSMLEAVGGAETTTADPRSRRLARGDPWGLVEDFEKLRETERR